jgi:hypothetical protein
MFEQQWDERAEPHAPDGGSGAGLTSSLSGSLLGPLIQ